MFERHSHPSRNAFHIDHSLETQYFHLPALLLKVETEEQVLFGDESDVFLVWRMNWDECMGPGQWLAVLIVRNVLRNLIVSFSVMKTRRCY